MGDAPEPGPAYRTKLAESALIGFPSDQIQKEPNVLRNSTSQPFNNVAKIENDMRTRLQCRVFAQNRGGLGTRNEEGEPSMEADGPCGDRLIVVMSQDLVGVSEL